MGQWLGQERGLVHTALLAEAERAQRVCENAPSSGTAGTGTGRAGTGTGRAGTGTSTAGAEGPTPRQRLGLAERRLKAVCGPQTKFPRSFPGTCQVGSTLVNEKGAFLFSILK